MVVLKFSWYKGLAAGDTIRNKGNLLLLPFYELCHNAKILDAVESVLGPDILCWGASLFVKEAGSEGLVAFHQDSYYWGLGTEGICSAWVALTPSSHENGAMRVLPRAADSRKP